MEWIDWLRQQAGTIWEQYGPGVVAAIITLLIGWIVARILTSATRRVMTRARVDSTLVGFTGSLLYLGLMTLVIITALGKLGVQTASFVAVIGAAGLAIGFALQGSLANFAAGVMLIVFRPFKVGDYVEAAGIGGVVEDIQVFATKFRTPDNKAITVPNGAISAGNITNFSTKETRRIDLVFGIGYGDDIRKARKIIQDILARDSRILADPAPAIVVAELGESSVNLAVRPWVKSADYWDVFFHLTETVKYEFDQQGVSIPFPQRDVHIHQVA